MGEVKVLSFTQDQDFPGRLIIKVKALSQSMACVRSGNHNLILRVNEQIAASIAATAFPDLKVGNVIDGNQFCRFAWGHLKPTV